MRICVALCCFALSGAAFAQQPGRTLEQTIEKYLFGGYVDGQGVKQMRRAGDSAAVALSRVLSDRELSNDQIECAASILDSAFSEPGWIENPSDREPRTTLLILRYLDLCAQGPPLKAKIAEVRRHVTDQAAKPVKPNP